MTPRAKTSHSSKRADDDKDIEMYLHNELNRCRQQLDEARKQLEEEQSERNKESRSSQKIIESLKRRVEHLEGEGAGSQTLQTSPPGKEKKLKNSTDALEKSEIMIKQLTNELSTAKNEMAARSKEHDEKINSYKRDYSEHIKLLEERLAQIEKDRKLIDESRQLLKVENSRLERELHENDGAIKTAKELVDEKDKIIENLEQIIVKDKQAANTRHEQDLKKIKSRDEQIESLERTIANLKDTLATVNTTQDFAANATDVYNNNTSGAKPTSKSNRVATGFTIGLSVLVVLVLALKSIAMMLEEEIILRPT
jgi:chromosome segregation ATPase